MLKFCWNCVALVLSSSGCRYIFHRYDLQVADICFQFGLDYSFCIWENPHFVHPKFVSKLGLQHKRNHLSKYLKVIREVSQTHCVCFFVNKFLSVQIFESFSIKCHSVIIGKKSLIVLVLSNCQQQQKPKLPLPQLCCTNCEGRRSRQLVSCNLLFSGESAKPADILLHMTRAIHPEIKWTPDQTFTSPSSAFLLLVAVSPQNLLR